MAKITGLTIGVQSGTSNTLYARWSFASKYEKNLDHYSVNFYYYTGQGIQFPDGTTDTKNNVTTYTPPSNATSVWISVKPISKKYKSKGKQVSYWTGERVGKSYYISKNPPEKLSPPDVTIENRELTATVETYDSRADQIEFYVARDNSKYSSGVVSVVKNRAQYTKTIGINGLYRVKARAINVTGSKKVYGEWSEYSGGQETRPNIPTYVTLFAQSDTSVRVSWDEIKEGTVDYFEVQCVHTRDIFFNDPAQIKSTKTEGQTTWVIVSGLDPGKQWFFRVRSVNAQGESPWSTIKSIKIGTKPEAPTTWTLTNSVIVGEDITFYWVHNSEDNSIQQQAQLYLSVDGREETIDIDTPSTNEKDQGKVYSYLITTHAYGMTEGAVIKWKVRTKGVLSSYSPWSELRTIKVYAKPSVQINLNNSGEYSDGLLTSLPLIVDITASPSTQKLTSLMITVTAENTYESEDELGRPTVITAGTSMYKNIYNSSTNPRTVLLSANYLKLENGESYRVTVTTAMNSGLTATESEVFTVEWDDALYEPDASMIIDNDALAAYIMPYCKDENDELIQNVILSVYRREFDGTFTEVGRRINNNGYSCVTDPHPSLDYARYRIVATDKNTGIVGYTDLPAIPIDEHSIVIQWDEEWVAYDYHEEDTDGEPTTPPWCGSMLKIPYNIDISERHASDKTLVNYIGREQPISYYGTQRGSSATWSCVIPKDDKEMLHSLRRLANWMGDVYIREPSGTGYWAQISVSMDVKHKSVTVPVTFEINRVEGDL